MIFPAKADMSDVIRFRDELRAHGIEPETVEEVFKESHTDRMQIIARKISGECIVIGELKYNGNR